MSKSFLGISLIIIVSAFGACVLTTTSSATASTSKTDLATSVKTIATNNQTNTFTLDDVSTHNSKSDCWMAIKGEVYDVTDYIRRHPGGNQIILGCGTDASSMFASIRGHGGRRAQSDLDTLQIGTLQ